MTQKSDILPLSRLKGISIYYENDLYETALLKLKLNDARAKCDGSNTISRPTVNGLVKIFAQLVDTCYPDYDRVFSVTEEHNLPLNAKVEFDNNENC